jgi:hypothetical protein
VKTIVGMANTEGGEVHLKKLACDEAKLDSARLDDLVNKYILPKYHAIRSKVSDAGRCIIEVEQSALRPHVFAQEASYSDGKGRTKSAFYPGQVYVRHSSKTDPATGEDFQRIIRDGTSEVLRTLGKAIEAFSFDVQASGGMPVTLGAGGLLQVTMKDANLVYPYTTKTLGEKLSKDQNWVAIAARRLGIWGNSEYCWQVLGGHGVALFPKYNEAAYERLRAKMDEDPDFNPYARG